MARDFVRHVQELRKKADFHVADRIVVHYLTDGEAAEAIAQHAAYIQQETLAETLSATEPSNGEAATTFTLGGRAVRVSVTRVPAAQHRSDD